jgi:PAS domain S-box-containing protein
VFLNVRFGEKSGHSGDSIRLLIRVFSTVGVCSGLADTGTTKVSETVEEKALLERKDGVERLYAIAPVGLCYFDTDLRFRYINEWLARINGIPAEEHLGKTIDELLEDVAGGVVLQLRHVLETGEPITEGEVEAETPAHPGELRHFMHNYYPDKRKDGTVVGVSCVVQDITERVALEREVVSAGEHERRRIGRDLHDGLGQELTAVSLSLRSLRQKLEDEHSAHSQTVQNLTATIQDMIADTRRIARELSPVFSTELGLCAAFSALAKEISENTDVKCDAHCLFNDDIHDVEVATHLYRIAQESVNNALKHGGVRNIELRYGHDGDSLFLEVLDDGTGIPAKDSRVDGMGLRSMHYRARMLHGRLEIGRRTQGGTRVLCSCPSRSH